MPVRTEYVSEPSALSWTIAADPAQPSIGRCGDLAGDAAGCLLDRQGGQPAQRVSGRPTLPAFPGADPSEG